MDIDRDGLGEFLRRRRGALQPEDVGLPRGVRRRTAGLRREEVAQVCHLSPDYYARLERGQGPHPSVQMVASIAQGLHLTLDERDHVFRLAGHQPPPRGGTGDHLSPGLLRILDRLQDTPAEVIGELGETLRQTPPGAALLGDASRYRGLDRSLAYRWFTDPTARDRHDPADHEQLSRLFVSWLRVVATRRGRDSRAAGVVDDLLGRSEDFRRIWERGEVGLRPDAVKRFVHPELGALELHCQTLVDADSGHTLLVYTAVPGSESHEKLQWLAAVG